MSGILAIASQTHFFDMETVEEFKGDSRITGQQEIVLNPFTPVEQLAVRYNLVAELRHSSARRTNFNVGHYVAFAE